MANEQTAAAITNAVAIILPSVIGLIKALFAKAHPDVPVPTDAEIMALFAATCMKSLAVDDAWLAAHPT